MPTLKEHTHYCCNKRLDAEGGYAGCCKCEPHKKCSFTKMFFMDNLKKEWDEKKKIALSKRQNEMIEFTALSLEIKDQLVREQVESWNLDFVAGRLAYLIQSKIRFHKETFKQMIIEEINIAHSEGQSTSRLTSLFNKID